MDSAHIVRKLTRLRGQDHQEDKKGFEVESAPSETDTAGTQCCAIWNQPTPSAITTKVAET